MTAILLCLALCGAPQGEIAFVGGTNQLDQCVCVLDVASGEVRRVGMGKRDDAPRWSPDGQWLAFETQSPDGLGINIVRADGMMGRALQHQCEWNFRPRWSPDGKKLTYVRDMQMSTGKQIVVYDLETDQEDGWGKQVILSMGEEAGSEEGGPKLVGWLQAVWLHEATLLKALAPEDAQAKGGLDLERLEKEALESGALLAIGLLGSTHQYTTEPFLVTRNMAVPILGLAMEDSARYAEWAMEPNRKSSRIAFESNDGGDREIFVLGKRGVVDVTNHRAADWNPVWAYDGKWLAFESFRGGRRGVYRVFSETARVFPVATSRDYDCWSPSWSKDGEWIAFVSNQTGMGQIYLKEIDSGKVRQMTRGETYAYAPMWRPEAK